jgi:hypothetical protein
MTELRGRPLVKELERRFVVAHSRVELPGGAVDMMHPENTDALISEEDMVRDDRLPYWADIWPSSRILARALARSASPPSARCALGTMCWRAITTMTRCCLLARMRGAP